MTGSSSHPSLRDKPVLVTGGASGIGAALVTRFAREGAKVAFLDLDEAAGTALAEEAGALFRACDLIDTDALTSQISSLEQELGAFRVLVNNAARDDRQDISTITREQWDASMAVNLTHHAFAAQAVQKGMAAAGGGAIINMSSVNARGGLATLPDYSAAKAAIIGLTHSLARAFGPDNIRVNAVLPGWVMTERQISKWLTPEAEEWLMEAQCLATRIEPEDVADFVVFLASDDARVITNQSFVIDAGRT